MKHLTASAVIFNEHNEVLLVHHRRYGVWVFPGGHVAPDESPSAAAVREVREETGVEAVLLVASVLNLPESMVVEPRPLVVAEMDSSSKPGQPDHRHIDLLYVGHAAKAALVPQVDEVFGAQWVDPFTLGGLPAREDVAAIMPSAVVAYTQATT